MTTDYTPYVIRREFLDYCYEISCGTTFGRNFFVNPNQKTDDQLVKETYFINGFEKMSISEALKCLVAMLPKINVIDLESCSQEVYKCLKKRIDADAKKQTPGKKRQGYSNRLLTDSGNDLKTTKNFDAFALILAVSMLQHLISKKASIHGDFRFIIEPPSGN